MSFGSMCSDRCFRSFLTSLGQGAQRDSSVASHSKKQLCVHGVGFLRDGTCMGKFTVGRKRALHVVLRANHQDHLVSPGNGVRVVKNGFLGEEPCSCHHLQNSVRRSYNKMVKRNISVHRASRQCLCFLSSDPPNGSWIHSRKIHKTCISFDSQYQQLDFHLIAKTFSDFKSEQFDFAPTTLDPLKTPGVLDESTLVDEESGKTSHWWEQFPKRWLIVLLCFTAFLLCNMDRVNMSIAILPMSTEFKWSPATVGLIQSSFFWGYLLTQIVGGIWADKIGGKIVLGFGVVWWSLATILTPIAARLGLPIYLLCVLLWGLVRELLCLL